MSNANRDANRVTSLLAQDYSNAANEVAVTADPATGRMLTQTTGVLTDDELRAAPVPTTDSTAQALLQQIESNSELLAQLAVVVKNQQQATVDPPYLDKSVNAIRNQVQSGTITTVTTVTTCATVTNMSQVDSYQGKLLMIGQDISAWANVVRGRIT